MMFSHCLFSSSGTNSGKLAKLFWPQFSSNQLWRSMSETGLLLLSASIYGTKRITPPLKTNHFVYSNMSKLIDRQFQNKYTLNSQSFKLTLLLIVTSFLHVSQNKVYSDSSTRFCLVQKSYLCIVGPIDLIHKRQTNRMQADNLIIKWLNIILNSWIH